MEKYWVSLELAKKMRSLGFPQETEFYWCYEKYSLDGPKPK